MTSRRGGGQKMKGKILTIPVDFGWNDMGGWLSLVDLYRKDRAGNVAIGKTLLIDSSGNIVKSQGRLAVLLGMENHVLIDTPDAVLVCPKGKTESIRSVVEILRKKKWVKYL